MTRLLRILQNSRFVILSLLATAFVLTASSAHGQYADQNVCNSGYVSYQDSGQDDGWSDAIEQTVCITYTDGSGIDSYVETDNDYYEDFYSEYGLDNMWTYGVSAEAQLVGFDANNNSYVVADSGMVDSWTDNAGGQWVAAQISNTPQQYLTYQLNGSFLECISGDDYWNCNWQVNPYLSSDAGLSVGMQLQLLPTVAVATSDTPSVTGQPVTFTATVTSGAQGDVGFYICCTSYGGYFVDPNTSNYPLGTISGNTATYTATWLSAGTYSVAAYYYADVQNSLYAPAWSNNTIQQVVQNAPPTVSTTASVSMLPATTYVNNPVTANVAVAATGNEVPDGVVTCSVPGTSATGSSNLANGVASVVLSGLPTGSYSVNCGYGGSAEFIPSTAPAASEVVVGVPQPTWTSEGAMGTTRYMQTATLLPNGSVLIAGGNSNGYGDAGAVNTAELYTPSSSGGTGSFTPTSGSMFEARWLHTATLLTTGPLSGQVLILGGQNINQLADAELYDPSTQLFSQAPHDMNNLRSWHTATPLQDGTILIAGGTTGCNGCGTSFVGPAEIYNPTDGTFTAEGTLNVPRYEHTATVLQNGEVLIVGGRDSSNSTTSSAELYNPATKTFTATGNLNVARSTHVAVLLSDGTVLIAGGQDNNGNPLANAELYNPTTGTFSITGSLNTARFFPGATLLNSGKVLVYGGASNGNLPPAVTTTAEVFDPSSGTFTATTSLNTARYLSTTTVLNDGTVLTTGGFGASQSILSSAEVYSPNNNTITGVINPKYIIMGVTYAPPGGTQSTVSYGTSNYVGNTNTIKNSFSTTNGFQVSIAGGPTAKVPLVGFFQEKVTGTASTAFTQTNTASQTITTTGQTSNNWTTPGTLDPFNPIDHDQDIIWLWINPTVILSVNPNNPAELPVWNGYGYDACDPANGIDVVGIKVGYLNGDIQDTQSQYILSRPWEYTNPNCGNPVYPNGDTAALSSSDYTQILKADPFSTPGYSVYPAPGSGVTTTSDGRFTQATSTNGTAESMYYLQENPQWHEVYAEQYANTNTQATTAINETKVSWSVAEQFQASFFVATVQYNLQYSGSVTIDNETDTSITNTVTNTGTVTIEGPPCSGNPCNPAYSGVPPIQPSLFDVYQDTMYGTFMFYGVN